MQRPAATRRPRGRAPRRRSASRRRARRAARSSSASRKPRATTSSEPRFAARWKTATPRARRSAREQHVERDRVDLGRLERRRERATVLDGREQIAQLEVLRLEAPSLERAMHDERQLLGADRLVQIVRRAHAQRLHGAVERGVRRDQDDVGAGVIGAHAREQLQTREPRQVEVGQEQVDGLRARGPRAPPRHSRPSRSWRRSPTASRAISRSSRVSSTIRMSGAALSTAMGPSDFPRGEAPPQRGTSRSLRSRQTPPRAESALPWPGLRRPQRAGREPGLSPPRPTCAPAAAAPTSSWRRRPGSTARCRARRR